MEICAGWTVLRGSWVYKYSQCDFFFIGDEKEVALKNISAHLKMERSYSRSSSSQLCCFPLSRFHPPLTGCDFLIYYLQSEMFQYKCLQYDTVMTKQLL